MNELPDISELRHEERQKLNVAFTPNGVGRSHPNRRQVSLKTSDAFSIYKADYPPPVFMVEDLLPVGLTLAAGRPKVGKSWLTLRIAIAAAFGEIALGRFRVHGAKKVVYLALEEPESRTHHRLHQLVPEPDIRLENI